MDQNEADPTGAFRGGSAGIDEAQTEYERHAPDGAEPGGGQPNTGSTRVDGGEREAETERQGDGTPRPR